MIANDNKIGGRTVDYTKTLEFIAGHMMGPGCSVILTPPQFEILKAYLGHIQRLGSRVFFQLEQCIDHAPGYSVSWDNQGNAYQDDAVDAIMEHMVQNIGFDGGSIERPGHLIDLSEIDDHVKVLLSGVSAKHGLS